MWALPPPLPEASAKSGTIAHAQNARDPKIPGVWRAKNVRPRSDYGLAEFFSKLPIKSGGFLSKKACLGPGHRP